MQLSFPPRLQRVLKERFFGPSRPFRKDIGTLVQIDSGDIPSRASLYLISEFGVDRLIANAVRNDIGSSSEYRFGVFQVVDMSRYSDAGAMRFIDDSLINLRFHLGRSSQQIVDPDFHEIRMASHNFPDRSFCFFGSLRAIKLICANRYHGRRRGAQWSTDAAEGAKQIGAGRLARMLFVAQLVK